MNRRASTLAMGLAVVAVVLAGLSGARAEQPASLDEQVKALQASMASLQNQIADLESQAARQQAIADVLKQMGIEAAPNDLRLYWKDGIRMDSRDGNIKLKFGGRLMYDMSWIGDDPAERLQGELADGFETRRARLYVEGDLWKNVGFKWEYDWASGAAVLRDGFLEFKELPVVGNLRLGHFKEPFSLDELTSSRYITFIERALPNAFVPGYNGGAMIYDHVGERFTWAAGVFRDTAGADGGQARVDGQYMFTTRLTYLPYYEDKGKRLVHLGTSYSIRHMDAVVRYRSRPEVNITAQRFVDTGNYFTRDISMIGAEAATVWGPFHAEAEYIVPNMAADNNVARVGNQPDPNFHGYYVQAGYFLTGETRPYKTSSGTFDRVKPLKPYGQGGYGAWEVAGRLSYLDLDDDRIDGGKLWDYTLGLNWYVNNNVRLMWNYVRSRFDVGPGPETRESADALTMRIQFDF